jgi:uncharacterized protein
VTVIGIEEHWTFPAIDTALRAQPSAVRDASLVLNEHGDAGVRLGDLGVERLSMMDAQGVDMQVLSLAPPGTQGIPTADAIALSRDANDAVAAAIAAHPTRFAAMATLPLADPAAAAAELERATALGLRGAMAYGRVGDLGLDDDRFDDLWAVAEAHQQPVFIHPQIAPDAVRRASYSGFDELAELAMATFSWGWHLEAGTAALRMMTAGVLDRHPALQLVLGHWGELLLYWHERANSLARIAGRDRSVTEYLRQNVWITASGMLDPAQLQHTLAVTTPDRLLFSTDYPFQQPTAAQIEQFLDAFPSPTDREAFTSGNAQRLFTIN